MSTQLYCVLDYETRSKCDLKKAGAHKYARDPSTQILCIGWRVGTVAELRHEVENKVPARIWSPAFPAPYGELKRAFENRSMIFVAQNAFFEQCITKHVLTRLMGWAGLDDISPDRWICTAARAAALALPRSLEGAGGALELPIQKDLEGHRLMLKLSKPRKPTKHNPAVWHQKASDLRRLMAYCQTDVDAETWLFLTAPPLIPQEKAVWELDQKINFRGFRVDVPLIKNTMKLIAQETARLDRETAFVTGGRLTTTRQRDRVQKYVQPHVPQLVNLRRKTVEDTLKAVPDMPAEIQRLLKIRLAVSLTSTAKYQAALARAEDDGRVRDTLLYHAAGPGRWGGRGFQPQNLTKSPWKDPTTAPAAADLLRDADLETVRLMLGPPMTAFSACVRSIIIPETGKLFFDGDFSAIEARIVFWLAGHEKGLQAYREGRDQYVELAEVIYGKKITKEENPTERDVAKRAVLGCLAEGTLILTKTGRKPIESIQDSDLLWSGLEWVRHQGVLSKGLKTVIRIESLGIELTSDHWIKCGGAWRSAGEIALELDTLSRAPDEFLADGRLLVANSTSESNVVSVYAAYAELSRRLESTNCGEERRALAFAASNLWPDKRAEIENNLALFCWTHGYERALTLVSTISKNAVITLKPKIFRVMEVEASDASSKTLLLFWNTLLHLSGLTSGGLRSTASIMMGTMPLETYVSSLKKLTTRTVQTYDVAEVGSLNQFQAGKAIVHNCGFGMGWKKFAATCEQFGQPVTTELAQKAVMAYRNYHAPVARLWGNYERAAIAAVRNPGKTFKVNKVKWFVEGKFLFAELPSGRRNAYYGPSIRYEQNHWGDKVPRLYHWGVNPKTKQWMEEGTYGGKLTENCVQGHARDVMANTMERLESAGYDIVLTVHDEVLAEGTLDKTLDEFLGIMKAVPTWTEGLPLEVSGWTGDRYRK